MPDTGWETSLGGETLRDLSNWWSSSLKEEPSAEVDDCTDSGVDLCKERICGISRSSETN